MEAEYLERKMTTSISISIKNQMWIDDMKIKYDNFTLSKFVDSAITSAKREERNESKKSDGVIRKKS